MHPALQLRNLALLPLPLRSLAADVANGSVAAMDRLLRTLKTLRVRGTLDALEEYKGCIPALYANLCAPIPSVDDGEDPILRSGAVHCAILSLDCIIWIGKLPLEAGSDLWLRVWPWFMFLHAHRDRLPGPIQRDEKQICRDIILFIEYLWRDTGAVRIVDQTVGVRAMIGRAWALLCEEVADPEDPGFVSLSHCLLFIVKGRLPQNLDEIIQGVGGSRDQLASLVVKYLKVFLPAVQRPMSKRTEFFFSGILAFITDIDDTTGPMATSLVAHGTVPLLVKVACAFTSTHLDYRAEILQQLLRLLASMLSQLETPIPSHRTVEEAIAAGLFRALIFAVVRPRVDLEPVQYLLTSILPQSTLFAPVVARMQAELPAAKALANSEEFKTSEMFTHWKYMVQVAEERIRLLEYLHSPIKAKSSKACDNMECGVIGMKQDFRRCSSCERVYYCSVTCQARDWREGGHRRGCRPIQIFDIRHPEYLKKRELAFMRTVLDFDASHHRVEILLYQLVFIRKHPSTPFITVFEYSSTGRMRLKVCALDEEEGFADVHCDEYASRASKSNGRMELHMAVVQNGEYVRPRMFPMRCNTSVLRDGLREIAADLNADPENLQTQARVKALVDMHAADLVEIHV
ncbi:hypothetical protein B0H11DRAFT_2293633 [Mycena galericulata]|nr:hypothetical protein B0H11DRAFT_2293633 [Mycena galericulata]